jgi:hypothetical protein
MGRQRWESTTPAGPYIDRTPQPFGDGPPDPKIRLSDTGCRITRRCTGWWSIASGCRATSIPPISPVI